MERKHHLAVKPLGAAGRKPVNNEKTALTHLEGGQQLSRGAPRKVRKQSARLLSHREISEALLAMTTRLGPCPSFPPAFDAQRTLKIRRRFVSEENSNLASASFSLGQGHNQFLVVTATGASDTGTCYVDVWRIKKVYIWCINYIDNGTTVNIRPQATDSSSNNFNDREAVYSCSSRSEAEPGHMCIVPSPASPMGCWHKASTINSSEVLFYLEVNYGGASSGNWATVTMDIEFEAVENLTGAPQGYTRTTLSTGHTLGTLGGCNLFGGGMLLQDINVLV